MLEFSAREIDGIYSIVFWRFFFFFFFLFCSKQTFKSQLVVKPSVVRNMKENLCFISGDPQKENDPNVKFKKKKN